MANKTDKLNVFLANLAVLNIKVHNLHWNVVGLQFPLIHKMTEKIYKMLQCQFDTVAEVMKMQNKMPAASMAEYLDKTTIGVPCKTGVLGLLDQAIDGLIIKA